jgi:hypothetical protein
VYQISADNATNQTLPTAPVWPVRDAGESPAASPAG